MSSRFEDEYQNETKDDQEEEEDTLSSSSVFLISD